MRGILPKMLMLTVLATSLGFFVHQIGLDPSQSLSIAVFAVSILGTLFFWEFRLSFAFLGTSFLLIFKAIDLEHLIKFSSLEVILFLVGMMVIVGLLKDEGFFAWVVQLMLRIRNLTAKKFVLVICGVSAALSAMTSEVVSIIFIVAAVLEICDYFEVDPLPFIIISVLATNIGSAATLLGNPIGILIASKSGLTFEDFIVKAFPLSVICLLVCAVITMAWYRKTMHKLDQHIKEFGNNEMLIKLISVPAERRLKISLWIFFATLLVIAFTHRIELLLGLPSNTMLLVVPLISSAGIMIWKRDKAREYVEKDVEWWTLLFFLLLFAQAGTLKFTGATDVLAAKMVHATGSNPDFLLGIILWIGTIGSSILDNVVLVAAFIPIIQGFGALQVKLQPLWWALLFGGCLGGNITLVGSTANIVALGILEKERNLKVKFFQWFWIGLVVGVVTTAIVWLALLVLPVYS